MQFNSYENEMIGLATKTEHKRIHLYFMDTFIGTDWWNCNCSSYLSLVESSLLLK
jgi:hypothetical protein